MATMDLKFNVLLDTLVTAPAIIHVLRHSNTLLTAESYPKLPAERYYSCLTTRPGRHIAKKQFEHLSVLAAKCQSMDCLHQYSLSIVEFKMLC